MPGKKPNKKELARALLRQGIAYGKMAKGGWLWNGLFSLSQRQQNS